MGIKEVDEEVHEWHMENKMLHWEEADYPEEDDEEDWECPDCGRASCYGSCPL